MRESTDKPSTKKHFELKEWHRTVLLVLLLVFAIGFIVWSNNQYQTNFIDSF